MEAGWSRDGMNLEHEGVWSWNGFGAGMGLDLVWNWS